MNIIGLKESDVSLDELKEIIKKDRI